VHPRLQQSSTPHQRPAAVSAARTVALGLALLAAPAATASSAPAEEYAQVIAARGNDPTIKAFRERCETIAEVSETLQARLRTAGTASMDGIAADGIGARTAADRTRHTVAAWQVLAQYADEFGTELPRPQVSRQELDVLLRHYNATIAAAQAEVFRRARLVVSVERAVAAEVVPLCLVLPFLHVPDNAWTGAHVEALPEWSRTPEIRAVLEQFCLSAGRPRTAYVFATCRSRGEPENVNTSLPLYLSRAAEKLISGKEFQAALPCLRAGIESAEADGAAECAETLRFRLAELLNNLGHPHLAAEQLKDLIGKYPETSMFGEAVTLRMKCLYESQQFSAVVSAVPHDTEDERLRKHVPEILYVLWVTHRRLDQAAEAAKVQEMFLKKFPRHPLGADMYFASAMSALVASKPADAVQLLEALEHRYPTSKLIPKAHELQRQLAASNAAKAQGDPSGR
jgi:tetratricopeptide (TPR) repeat protein